MHDLSVLKEAAAAHPELVLSPFDSILEVGGFDAVVAVSLLLGGSCYVPTPRSIFARCLEESARNELARSRSVSYSRLAKKFGFSETHIRRMLKGTRPLSV